ncbi:thiolase family protein [Variovorax sp. J31P207]|uniref:thiolase family protein n=1 Tax=Variovorax sp. J31P207 TaxID=3053510 RepID=UPI0025783593|nr:thiolase family protein [Variovorax sp. J31P207]MDM0069946.1 thiolase family protein [Variovorax sp. J31P207]
MIFGNTNLSSCFRNNIWRSSAKFSSPGASMEGSTMGSQIQVGVIGSAVFAPRYPDRTSLEEALHAVTHAALRNAGLTVEDLDGMVVASCDQIDGRAISIMMASGSVGGVGRDILSTPSSGEHAFVLAALRVRSGMYRTQLVVSWNGMETDDINETQHLSTDPYYHRALPLDDLASHALQANALEAQVEGLRDAALGVVQTNRIQGAVAYPDYAPAPREKVLIERSKMLRFPLTEGMVSQPEFGVVALVLASDDWIAEREDAKVAWVHGMGWATEPGFLGDRDLATLPSLRAAAQQAYAESGTDFEKPDFDLAEVADATPYQQLVALEGLGLCPREQWVTSEADGQFAKGGKLPVNLSGGALSFNPVFCSGLMRIAEAANQARGQAGLHQQTNVAKTVAHGASGFAMQYNTVVVFGRDRRSSK